MIARVIAVTVPYPFQRRRYHAGNPTSYNDAQKPRDGSGTVSASARRALPFKRHSGPDADCETAFVARYLEPSESAIWTHFDAWFSHPTHR